MKNYAFGVDVGGTFCKLGLFETDGVLLERWEIPTDTRDGGTRILPDIAATIQERRKKLPENSVLGVGVGVPSPMTQDGVAIKSVNLGWENYPVAAELLRLTGLPVYAANDVNVASLGELWKGSAVGYSNAIVLTLGTGIGGGLIVNGHLVNGETGSAGEIGHVIVNPQETERCACGRKGCLEQYASATGLVRMAERRLSATSAHSILREKDPLTAKDIFDAAKAGDAIAVELVESFGQILGSALSDMACVLNPEIIVIGGGVSRAGSIVTDIVQRFFYEKTLFTCKNTKIVLATLGNDAGIYGGVRLLLERIKQERQG